MNIPPRFGAEGFKKNFNQSKKMNSKNKILIAVGICGVALSVLAATPAYKDLSAAGTAASPATLIFPADPYGAQIRIVSVNWKSDTNNATLQFSDGATAFTQVSTNVATSSVTNQINSTNGLVPGSVIVLQHAGVCYASTVSTFNESTNAGPYGGTNVVLASGGWGVAASVGDAIYQMNSPMTLTEGQTTNAMNGEAVFVSSLPGRPVMIKLTPALVTNSIPLAVARYE